VPGPAPHIAAGVIPRSGRTYGASDGDVTRAARTPGRTPPFGLTTGASGVYRRKGREPYAGSRRTRGRLHAHAHPSSRALGADQPLLRDRKSTRLNSSHGSISYAVFCLKKKT